MYHYSLIKDENSKLYNSLVKEKETPLFSLNIYDSLHSSAEKKTLVAYQGDTPIGIILIDHSKITKTGKLHSLYVNPSHRNKGVGTKLVFLSLEALRTENMTACVTFHTKDDPHAPFIEKILEKTRWEGTRNFMKRCYFNPYEFKAPWFHLNLSYPEGFESFLWKDLTDKERDYLRRNEKQGRFPQFLYPLKDEEIIEPINSLGLRYKKEIVGWLVTHRTDPDTIRYSSFFIEPSLKKRSLSIKLLLDSLHLHALSPTKSAFIEIPYLNVQADWLNLINKRLVPYSTEVIISMQSWLSLKPILDP